MAGTHATMWTEEQEQKVREKTEKQNKNNNNQTLRGPPLTTPSQTTSSRPADHLPTTRRHAHARSHSTTNPPAHLHTCTPAHPHHISLTARRDNRRTIRPADHMSNGTAHTRSRFDHQPTHIPTCTPTPTFGLTAEDGGSSVSNTRSYNCACVAECV